MPKESGLGMTTLGVDDSSGTLRDIRTDVTNFEFATPRETQDTTGVDKSAMERLLLLADFSITLNGVFDDGANLAHVVLKTAASTTVVREVSIGISGQTMTNQCILTDYALTRSDSGELTWTAPLVLSDGTLPTWS